LALNLKTTMSKAGISLAVGAALGIALLAWAIMDRPISTGVFVKATVVACQQGSNRAGKCVISIEPSHEQAIAYVPGAKVGQVRVFEKMQRRYNKRPYFAPVIESKVQLGIQPDVPASGRSAG
jgi:hypothetical protein